MARVELSLACSRYDRVRALADGEVAVEGVELRWIDLPPHEIFWRMLRHGEFDACEMSLSSYLIARERGTPELVGLPVFPARRFRHGSVFVREGAGITSPADLRGRRMGVPEYQVTAALWARGFLSDDHAVRPEDIRWVTGGVAEPGREEKLTVDPGAGVSIQHVADRSLVAMLLAGDIDGVVAPRLPAEAMRTGAIRTLLPDTRAAEQDYFRRTRIFPIMHVLVLRPDVHRRYPWIAVNLYRGFLEARDAWYERLHEQADVECGLPWVRDWLRDTVALMGEDFWPYGIEANRPTLGAAARYSWEQGLTRQAADIESLFAPSTLQLAVE